jgi:plastocyanin domain-containing protein
LNGSVSIAASTKEEAVIRINEPVTVEFTPRKGEFIFACGMDMLEGNLIVE